MALTLSCASLDCSVTSKSCSRTSARSLQDTQHSGYIHTILSSPAFPPPHTHVCISPGEGGDPGLESLELRRQSPVQSSLCHHFIMQAAEHTPLLAVPRPSQHPLCDAYIKQSKSDRWLKITFTSFQHIHTLLHPSPPPPSPKHINT